MFCPNCGKEIPDESIFCTECGFKIEVASAIEIEDKTEFIGSSPEPVPVVETTPIVETTPTPNPIPAPAPAPIPQTPSGDGGNNSMIGKVLLIVAAVLAGIFGIRQGYYSIRSLFFLFTEYIRYISLSPGWFFGTLSQLIRILLNVIITVGLLGMAATNLLGFLKYEKNKGKSLFTTGALLGVACIAAKIVGCLVSIISDVKYYSYYGSDFLKSIVTSNLKSTFVIVLICVVVAAVSFVAFALIGESISFAGGDIVGQSKSSVNDVVTMVKGAAPANTGAANTVPPTVGTQSGPAPTPGGTAPGSDGPLKTDRSLLMFILLGIVTCGIYILFFIYNVSKDVNTACEGDGQQTTGLLMYIVLSIVTCGIYAWIWYYKLANRLQTNAPRYGFNISENGTSVLLWMLLGQFICFIGSLVAMNIVIKNTNAICSAYNQSKGFYGAQ